MALGIAEFSAPGKSPSEKLRALEERGLWLELVNDGIAWKLARWRELLPSFRVYVRSVQAYLQHDLSLFSRSLAERRAAFNHVKQSIELAAKFGGEGVVTVVCYGKPQVADPWKEAVRVFKELSKVAEDVRITVSVEPLDRKRTEFLHSYSEVRKFVEQVASERVKLMLDTGHLWEDGEDPARVVRELGEELSELHLKDSGGLAPGRGELNFHKLAEICKEIRGLKCLEYKPSSSPEEDLELACQALGMV
jgi:sugar phosphate isomerase/epimerase